MSKKKDDKKKEQRLWIYLISLLILVIVLAGITLFYMNNKDTQDEKTLAYTDLIKDLSY